MVDYRMAKTKKPASKKKPAAKPATRKSKSSLLEALLLRLVSPLKSLPVQTVETVVYLRPEEIAFITTGDDCLRVFDVHGNEWRRFGNLTKLMEQLAPDPRFYRSHNSFIVNVFAIKAIHTNPKTNLLSIQFGDKVSETAGLARTKKTKLLARLEL